MRRFCVDVMDGEIDVALPALHGSFGEDGKIQGLMDCLRVLYAFSGCLASAKTKDELRDGIEEAFNHGNEVMLEEYIEGRELTVAEMGNSEPRPLPVIEIIPKAFEWFDYKAKYEEGASE